MIFPTEQEARDAAARFKLDGVRIVRTTHGWFAFVPKNSQRKPTRCSICGGMYPEYPASAWPINNGQCCAFCDDHVVTMARIVLAQRRRS